LKFQVVERCFESLDEVLIWVDRNQLGRRNLTDSQRTEVIGRIYNTKKMAQGRPRKDEKEVNLTSFSGSDATAKEVAKEVGVSEATVRRAGKFAEAVAALERISPKAAEIVRRDEVRDAKTQLPKVPSEALSFVASANFQRRPANRAGSLSLVALPTDWRCSRSQTLSYRDHERALQALNDDRLNLPFPSRA
jgi:hypothetical protein